MNQRNIIPSITSNADMYFEWFPSKKHTCWKLCVHQSYTVPFWGIYVVVTPSRLKGWKGDLNCIVIGTAQHTCQVETSYRPPGRSKRHRYLRDPAQSYHWLRGHDDTSLCTIGSTYGLIMSWSYDSSLISPSALVTTNLARPNFNLSSQHTDYSLYT